MELRHIRYFVALAEHGSFTRAAQAVHITQSTLSHQIRQLELEIGQDLFDRSGREVTLTKAGRAFLPGVQRAVMEINGAIRAIKDFEPQSVEEIRILTGSRSCARRVIASALPAPDGDAGQCSVKVEEVFAGKLPQTLDARGDAFEIVVGDLHHLPQGWTFEPLYHEDVGLLIPSEHRFAKRRRIRVSELHGEPIVLCAQPEPTRLIIDDVCARNAVSLRLVAEFNVVETMFEFASKQRIMAFAPCNLELGDSDMVFVSLEDPAPERTVGFMWPPRADISSHARTIADRIASRVAAFAADNDRNFMIRQWTARPKAMADG